MSGPAAEWRMHCQLALPQHYSETIEKVTISLSYSRRPWLLTQHCPHQGSFRCGDCKTGFTGDERRGCQATRLCPNGKPSPCDANGECVVERDGSISCRVSNKTILRH